MPTDPTPTLPSGSKSTSRGGDPQKKNGSAAITAPKVTAKTGRGGALPPATASKSSKSGTSSKSTVRGGDPAPRGKGRS